MNNLSFYSGKRIFVTGHTGFKGSWLCRVLVNAGALVTGFALEPEKGNDLFAKTGLENEMTSVIGDIRNFDSLKSAFDKCQPEIVFHLAAQPIVLESYRNPKYTYETNVIGTVNLLECVRQSDCVKSLLNVTTDKVYENDDLTKAFVEADKLDGFDPYSNSKSCSELVTHCYAKSFLNEKGVAVSTARAGNVIGGGDFAADRIIPDCIRAASKGEPIILRNPNSVRPFQHVLEPIFVYLLIAEKQYEDSSFCGCYNVGPDESDCITTGELATLFCKYWGEAARWDSVNMNGPHEAGFLKLNCDKLKNTFGWHPRWNIETAVEKTVEFTKAYLGGTSASDIMTKQINSFSGE
jgi:CDP-glucose 4,6-dehydratase